MVHTPTSITTNYFVLSYQNDVKMSKKKRKEVWMGEEGEHLLGWKIYPNFPFPFLR